MFGFKKAVITGSQDTPYLTRWVRKLRDGGSIRLHVFHRGDEDPDPHDHPSDFWTFPLRGYWEERHVREDDPVLGPVWRMELNYVRPWRWHFRPAEYVHRVVHPRNNRRIVTIVRFMPKRRDWCFWPAIGSKMLSPLPDRPRTYENTVLTVSSPYVQWRFQTPWREYLGLVP